jgi:hypothetical protein
MRKARSMVRVGLQSFAIVPGSWVVAFCRERGLQEADGPSGLPGLLFGGHPVPGDRLDQAVGLDGLRIDPDEGVPPERHDRVGEPDRVVERSLEQGARDGIGGQAGDQPEQILGHRLPDLAHGQVEGNEHRQLVIGGIASGQLVAVGGITPPEQFRPAFSEQVQVGTQGQPRLLEVGGGLGQGQGQVPQRLGQSSRRGGIGLPTAPQQQPDRLLPFQLADLDGLDARAPV